MLDVADGRSRRRWVVQVKLQDLVQVDVGGVLVLEIPHHFLELVEVKVLGPVLQEVEAQLGEQQVHDVLAQDQVGVDGGHGRHSVHGNQLEQVCLRRAGQRCRGLLVAHIGPVVRAVVRVHRAVDTWLFAVALDLFESAVVASSGDSSSLLVGRPHGVGRRRYGVRTCHGVGIQRHGRGYGRF